jgi:hypothetical protein
MFNNFFGSTSTNNQNNNNNNHNNNHNNNDLFGFGNINQHRSNSFFGEFVENASSHFNDLIGDTSSSQHTDPFNNPFENNPFGGDPFGDNPFENNPFENNPFENNPFGDDSFGDNNKQKTHFDPDLTESTLTELDIKMCNTCNICFDDFNIGEKGCVTSCGHIFHKDCISPWITKIKKHECPVCNKQFTTNSIKEETIDRWKKTADEQNVLGSKVSTVINMSVKEMKNILTSHGYDISKIFEKNELRDLVNELLYTKLSTKEITKILDEKKINYKNCLEKNELIRLLEVASMYNKGKN